MEEGRGSGAERGIRVSFPSPADAPAVLVTAFWQKGAIVYLQIVCNVSALSRSRRIIVIVRSERGKSARVIGMYFCVCVCVLYVSRSMYSQKLVE